MPRAQRKKSSTGIYHLVARGIGQGLIFEQDEDYAQFLSFLRETKKQSCFTLYAYCLMGNHFHLLLKEGAEPISLVFKRLGVRYAQWFNRKYERSGHLFQNRFGSEPVEADAYFLTVLLYLYQNPVNAGICRETTDYEWSSRRLIGLQDGLVDEKALLALVPLQSITEREGQAVEGGVLDEPRVGRRAAYADKTVLEKARLACGAHSGAEFQRLPREGC